MFQIAQMHYAAVRALFTDKKGATAIEYGLLAALISVVMIAGAQLVGTNLLAVFNSIAGKLTAAT